MTAATLVRPTPRTQAAERSVGVHVRHLATGPLVPGVLAAVALLGFAAAGTVDYLSYHSSAYDLGFFDQVVQRTAQGHPFQTTFLGYSFLGEHWEPVLLLFAPLDRLVATPLWLIGINSVALAAAPVFAWRLARTWLGGGLAPAVAALACVIDPLIARGAAFPYHSEALTPVLALAALDGAARSHRWRFLLPALALALVKEDALLVAAGVAWIAWCVEGRRDALVLLAGSLAALAVIVGVVMPAFRAGEPSDLAARYAGLGGTTPGALLVGMVTRPDRVLGRLVDGSARQGWAVALLPLAGLPLAAGRALLAVLPVLAVALLAAATQQSELLFHYGLEAFPLLLATALLGWRRLRTTLQARDGVLAAAACTALVAGYVLASPLPGGLHPYRYALVDLDRHAAVESVLARVPVDAAVSASTGLVPHLAARPAIYEFPDRAFEEPWVVLDDRGPRASWTLSTFDAARAALPAHGYHVVASASGVTLWAR